MNNNFIFNFNKKNQFNKIYVNVNLYSQYHFNKNFISFFFDFNLKKKNFLILDCSYLYVYPLYKYIFGVNILSFYKNFFFLKPIFFTRKSWSYFFFKFCSYNNIHLLFISDFDYYLNFYKFISDYDCSISAIVPYNYSDFFIDYPLYSSYINNLVKIVYISVLSQIFFYSFNKINLYLKYQYLNNFYKYITIKHTN